MAIYSNIKYGFKVFNNDALLLDLEPMGLSLIDKMVIAAVVGFTIFGAITHPLETLIVVGVLALIFS